MKYINTLFFIIITAALLSCSAQNKNIMDKNNPLLCDPDSGICEIPTAKNEFEKSAVKASDKSVRILYFTDPICSSCWGIEPQLRKLKLEYGEHLNIEYHMGGLLPDWKYNSGGISKPSDVAHHWDEVSAHYNMPIDGDVWLEDPLDSSFPPSIAFKAAQMQDETKAIVFLRVLREMVFLERKNITKWEHMKTAAEKSGLDVDILKNNYENDAEKLFRADLNLAAKMGVRGFPSVFIINEDGAQEFVYGYKPYSLYETAINKIFPKVKKATYEKTWNFLFSKYPTLTTREFAELMELSIPEGESQLEKLDTDKKIMKFDTKNGPLWKLI